MTYWYFIMVSANSNEVFKSVAVTLAHIITILEVCRTSTSMKASFTNFKNVVCITNF